MKSSPNSTDLLLMLQEAVGERIPPVDERALCWVYQGLLSDGRLLFLYYRDNPVNGFCVAPSRDALKWFRAVLQQRFLVCNCPGAPFVIELQDNDTQRQILRRFAEEVRA